jgi:hypothetical protein
MRPGLYPVLFGGPWTPKRLGPKLLAWWDAERADLITQAAGAVSSWRDIVDAYDAAQTVGASKPVWSGTSFNGRPGVTFDASDDELTLTPAPASFPTGASPGEVWVLTDQAALAADTTARTSVAYGGASATTRALRRVVSVGANLVDIVIGDGASFANIGGPVIAYSGRHVARGIIGATQSSVDLDGTAGTPAAVVPATAATRLRIGASSATSPAGFWNGTHSAILFTASLSADEATLMYAYLNRRL